MFTSPDPLNCHCNFVTKLPKCWFCNQYVYFDTKSTCWTPVSKQDYMSMLYKFILFPSYFWNSKTNSRDCRDDKFNIKLVTKSTIWVQWTNTRSHLNSIHLNNHYIRNHTSLTATGEEIRRVYWLCKLFQDYKVNICLVCTLYFDGWFLKTCSKCYNFNFLPYFSNRN